MEHEVKIITYVLEDNLIELKLLESHLQKVYGIHLSLHNDIDSFVDDIEQGVHIAIIDYHLGGVVNGIDVGKLVLEKNPIAYLVLFSGEDDASIWRSATNAGFRGAIYKGDKCCHQAVADMVENQLPAIRLRMELYEKYKPYAHVAE